MIQLLKLEFYKQKMSKMNITFFCIVLAGTFLSFLAGTEGEDFSDMSNILAFGNVLFRISFEICAGVLIAELIIGEYTHKTMQLLFTYPISRKKILLCKLWIVFAWTFVSILLANLLYGIAICLLNFMFPIIPNASLWDVVYSIPKFCLDAALTAGLSLIPLYFGFRKKSGTTTIVSAVLIASLINSSFGGSGEITLFSFIILPLLLCLSGIGIAYWTCKKIQVEDV